MQRRLERLEEHFRREWERLDPEPDKSHGERCRAMFGDWFAEPDKLNWSACHISWFPYSFRMYLLEWKQSGVRPDITPEILEEWEAEGLRLEELELPDPVAAIEIELKPPVEPGQSGLSERIAERISEKYGLERKARSISMFPHKDDELLDGPVLATHKPLDPDAPLPLA